MKHLDRTHDERPHTEPSGLRRLLRPGPRPWFHRPRPAEPDAHLGDEVGGRPSERSVHRADFDQLVALYRRALQLRDRGQAEARVGEDALSYGDELKADQHVAYGEHYRRRAAELDAAAERLLARLRSSHEGCEAAEQALRLARESAYGEAEQESRPEFA